MYRNKLFVASENKTKVLSQREVINFPDSSFRGVQDNIQLFQPPDMNVIEDAIDRLEDRICREHVQLALKAMNRRERWAMKSKYYLQ